MKEDKKKKRKKVTVQELQQHEKKYTYLLVGVFIALFIYLGYYVLTVPDGDVMSKVGKASTIVNDKNYVDSKNFFISSDLVTLEKEDIMTKEDGLKTNPRFVKVQNNTAKTTSYKIKLVKDNYLKNQCGCEGDFSSYVWVSSNGVVKKLSDYPNSVIYEGSVKPDKSDELWFYIWFDEDLTINDDTHFHGKFEIEY